MRWLTLGIMALAVAPAVTQAADEAFIALRPEAFFSTDADGNETLKTGLGWDIWRRDREHWFGVDVQHARISGDEWSHEEQRVYGHVAGTFERGEMTDDTWRWQVKAGGNGDTALGSASLNTEGPHRREIFFERELLDTQVGVERKQMYNLVGAAIDQPFGARFSGTALAGYQTFGDGNKRTHLRGNVVFAAIPPQGISVQLRTRYYGNSDPYLGGYYSPEWYGEALGVLQLRRVISGYTFRAVAGFGRQRSSDEDWKRARLIDLGFESPRWRRSWISIKAGYTDTPVATSTGMSNYSYSYAMLEAVVAF